VIKAMYGNYRPNNLRLARVAVKHDKYTFMAKVKVNVDLYL